MPRKCVSVQCKSGYKTDTSENVSIHLFPTDEVMRRKWLKAISRENFKPSKNSGVCSLHFHDFDFETESQDSNQYRKRKSLQKRRVKPTAVPSIFPNLPKYMSKNIARPRLDNSSSSRHQQVYERYEAAAEEFLAEENVSSLHELQQKLDRSCVPSGILEIMTDHGLVFYSLSIDDLGKFRVKYSLRINDSLDFQIFVQDVCLKASKSEHIVHGAISSCSEVLNLLAFAKASYEAGLDTEDTIHQCTELLESLLERMEPSPEQEKKTQFLIEQLSLSLKPTKGKRFSSYLLACSAMWENTSPALYKQILGENVLTLPTSKYLRNLTSVLTTDPGITPSTAGYLKARAKGLSEREKLVSVIIDEVYCSKQTEYSNGKFFGNEDRSTSKTILSFMIKSVASKYRDMVALFPINKLDSNLLKSLHSKVVHLVTEAGFDVVATITDGHSSNRKFFMDLCEGPMTPFVHLKPNSEDKTFLLFDSVHLLKNWYTNLLRKNTFLGPKFRGEMMAASFDHVRALYKKELGKSVKIAHKLNHKVIYPKPIERSKVDLANRFFHESTIAGLKFYGQEEINKDWLTTAHFLLVIRTWWDILNVRTPNAGFRKRDSWRDPIRNPDSDSLQFLKDFRDWLIQWKEMGNPECLSKETMTSAIQTTCSMPELAKYLLDKKELDFVLLGQISSDPIERRFGQYRQLAGANYFLSVRQFLEAEKKIRLNSLVRFSNLLMGEIKDIYQEINEENRENIQKEAQTLLLSIEMESCEVKAGEGDEAVIYYVGGYIARGLLKKISCLSCQHMVSQSKESPQVDFVTDFPENSKNRLLEQLNRGGLITPSDLVYISCLHA